jgi:hypothetical protein
MDLFSIIICPSDIYDPSRSLLLVKTIYNPEDGASQRSIFSFPLDLTCAILMIKGVITRDERTEEPALGGGQDSRCHQRHRRRPGLGLRRTALCRLGPGELTGEQMKAELSVCHRSIAERVRSRA